MSPKLSLLPALKAIVGSRHILTGVARTLRYRTGFRFGSGPAIAVVLPGTLVEQWRVLKLCAAANTAVIMQAANTGLTGGSTPFGSDYDRDIVIVNTLRLDRIRLIDGGKQVICHAGATLFDLENVLRPLGREPHSVIGSSCFGASVIGGVCNNSGGSLIQRGPAYTQMALFARIAESGAVELVNHLGVRLGDDPECILDRVESNAYDEADIEFPVDRQASNKDYVEDIRDVDADTPGRFNADPKRLFEASGSAGKVAVFAVRLDTFLRRQKTQVFYIGTNNPDELTKIRRHILRYFRNLPIEGEYIHRTAFDVAKKYGKDIFLAIFYLGTQRLPALFAAKARVDGLARRLRILPHDLSDRIMQSVARFIPDHLPSRMKSYRDLYEHHLLLRMAGEGIDEARSFLESRSLPTQLAFFECDVDEGRRAFLHRFAVAGAAVRYRTIHRREVEDIVALDVALRRNETNWFEVLPSELEPAISHRLYYGHFFCHVFHQDYIVRRGHDAVALEHRMWELLDARGAQYPAEHNVGHLYRAKPALVDHYRKLDPCNGFNPGIGQTPKLFRWQDRPSDPRTEIARSDP